MGLKVLKIFQRQMSCIERTKEIEVLECLSRHRTCLSFLSVHQVPVFPMVYTFVKKQFMKLWTCGILAFVIHAHVVFPLGNCVFQALKHGWPRDIVSLTLVLFSYGSYLFKLCLVRVNP